MEIIQTLPKLAKKIHIEEIVYSQNLFDAPGDFQLIERDALFRLRGFDERMIYGWHVDSNIGDVLNFIMVEFLTARFYLMVITVITRGKYLKCTAVGSVKIT